MTAVDSVAGTTTPAAGPARTRPVVHAVFVGLFALVVVPSRIFTSLQPPSSPPWSSLGLIVVLLEWLLLWRLCASRPYPTFLALAVAGIFLSAFRHPLVGAGVYLVLLVIHLHLEDTERAFWSDEARAEAEPLESSSADRRASAVPP
jgi:hypothetical protein